MNRFVYIIVFLLLWTLPSYSQTQVGYVKTKGRMVNGTLVPGTGISGAVIYIHGRNPILVHNNDGSFSFPVIDGTFRIDSIIKKGYQLVDKEFCSRTYKFSRNPLYLVVETPEQQLQDRLAAERKIRRTLTNQLHQREDEIEAQKEQQKITYEEYRHSLQQLYEGTDQNEQLVKDMVERYSKIDYDQLNEFDKKISEYILNGELAKADSLLRTKDDINERISQMTKRREELDKQQELLEQAEADALQLRDALANRCYRVFELFKMQHLNDSAAYYLELRTELDTTNIQWNLDAGSFIQKYLADYDKSLRYYFVASRQIIEQYGNNEPDLAICYHNIGTVYMEMNDYSGAYEYFGKALEIRKTINDENPSITNKLSISSSLVNIGQVYYSQGDYKKALEYYQGALNYQKSYLSNQDPVVANSYMAIGSTNMALNSIDTALYYYNLALQTYNSLYGGSSPYSATCYNEIGVAYENLGKDSLALENHLKALSIRENTLKQMHPDIACSYINIGSVYENMGLHEQALAYYERALAIFQEKQNGNNLETAQVYNNIGVSYFNINDYAKALRYFEQSLEIMQMFLPESHPNIKTIQENISIIIAVPLKRVKSSLK